MKVFPHGQIGACYEHFQKRPQLLFRGRILRVERLRLSQFISDKTYHGREYIDSSVLKFFRAEVDVDLS